ncbi:MAG: IS1634 family transposase [Myxococcota bacterium]
MDLRSASIDSRRLHHLPLLREVIDELGILEAVEEALPKHSDAKVSDGDCLLLMMLNILHGRCALYRMHEWLDPYDTDVILGENCPKGAFTDTRLGQALDHIFDFGTDTLFSRIAIRILQAPQPTPARPLLRGDTTSLVLHGAYDREPENNVPTPARGYSKDHRPDLKQLMMSLCLDEAQRPRAFFPLDGNTADQTANRQLLDELAKQLKPTDDVTWIGDAKLVDADTIGKMLDQGFHVISLLPKTFSLRRELIDAIDDNEMAVVADKPAKKKGADRRVWKAASAIRPFVIRKSRDADPQSVSLRFVVVHSSQLEAKYLSGLEKKLDKEEKALRRSIPKKAFACQADAEAAFDQVRRHEKLLEAQLSVVVEEVTLKRSRRGRPKAGEKAPSKMEYRVVLDEVLENEEAMAAALRQASHFVLVTDHLDEMEWSDELVFETYQGQQDIEGTTGFRWLKDAYVAPVFLKTPHRIAALMFVFVVSLAVRNHLQSKMRSRLAELDEEIRYYTRTRRTKTPTAEVIFDCFDAVTIIRARMPDGAVLRQIANLSEHAKKVLDILQLNTDIFTTVRKMPSRYQGGP